MGHNYIGTEHLLIAIMRESESIAVRVLRDLGSDSHKLLNEIISLLNENIPSTSSANNNKVNNTPTLNQFGRDLNRLWQEKINLILLLVEIRKLKE